MLSILKCDSLKGHRAGLVAMGSVMMLLAACQDQQLPTTYSRAPAPQISRSPSPHTRGLEDVFVNIDHQLPGFGGFSADSDGYVRIYVANPGNDKASIAAVRGWLESHDYAWPSDHLPPIRLLRGQFGFAQLIDWERALIKASSIADHAVLYDADESRDRVRVLVRDEAGRAHLMQTVTELGIPADAVYASVDDLHLRLTGTVDDRWVPIPDGVQIGMYYPPDSVEVCTLGYNVIVNGLANFLTASHCTRAFDGTVLQPFQQPAQSYNTIGYISLNPAWNTSFCPAGASYCRLTDAALGGYAYGLASWNFRIAKTSWIGSGNSPGGLWVDSLLFIGGPQPTARPQGLSLYKTGAGSGTTTGVSSGTCVTTAAIPPFNLSVDCAYYAQMDDEGSDSGAPVFYWRIPLPTNTRIPEGIAFARGTDQYGRIYAFYSFWGDIQSDLGVTMNPTGT